MPEQEVRLTKDEKDELLYLMIDGTERPILRSKKPGKRRKIYSGKKKIMAIGPAQNGSRHDKRIFDESRVVKAA